jgi:nucleoside-diphosphate-sugar epimerase
LQQKLPAAPQKSAYCWAHVDDVARGHILAMQKGKTGESYIIAGQVCSLIDALGLAEKITGIPVPRLHPSPGFLKMMSGIVGIVEKVVPLPELYSSETLRVSAGVTYLGSNEKAKRELGYSIRPLEEGFREMLLYDRQQLGIANNKA